MTQRQGEQLPYKNARFDRQYQLDLRLSNGLEKLDLLGDIVECHLLQGVPEWKADEVDCKL